MKLKSCIFMVLYNAYILDCVKQIIFNLASNFQTKIMNIKHPIQLSIQELHYVNNHYLIYIFQIDG